MTTPLATVEHAEEFSGGCMTEINVAINHMDCPHCKSMLCQAMEQVSIARAHLVRCVAMCKDQHKDC